MRKVAKLPAPALEPLDEVWFRTNLGSTARERLDWLLDEFFPADLAGATAAEVGRLYALANAYPWTAPRRDYKTTTSITRRDLRKLPADVRRIVREAGERDGFPVTIRTSPAPRRIRRELMAHQSMLRTVLDDLLSGTSAHVPLGELAMTVRIGQPVGVIVKVFEGPLPGQMILATLDYLQAVGVNRLRRCPYNNEGEPCGRLFIARKGQRFCTPAHARSAAYNAWTSRGRPRGTKGPRRETRAAR